MHSPVFKARGAHGASPTEKIFQMKGQASTPRKSPFLPPQSLQSPGQQLDLLIHPQPV